MYTSVTMMALAGLILSAPAAETSLAWQHNYSAAREMGARLKRPLAIVIGSGKDGYQGLHGNGTLAKDVHQLLQTEYVPVYVDVSTDEGRQLAQRFQIRNGSGIVLSNRAGDLQAFHHDGTISEERLRPYLQRFAQPDVVVTTTVQTEPPHTSFYPPSSSFGPPQGSFGPPSGFQFAPTFRFGGSRSC